MRIVCLHADTVDALKRLSIRFDDLTPNGLWSSQYHLVGLTPDQADALDTFQIEAEDVTPPQLIQVTAASKQAAAGAVSGQRAVATAGVADIAGTPDETGREGRAAGPGVESEVPLAQARDAGARKDDMDGKPDGKAGDEGSGRAIAPQGAGAPAGPPQAAGGQKNATAKGGGGITAPAQGGRKGQQGAATQSGGQRYGTTRLRISVAGKYTEATVANGKIVVGGRTFDSPDQAAAELTKSRGDWTFWEYYDSADGKWRMLTRDWDTVLKSAAPGGR